MKRRDLVRHLEKHGCEFLREGGNHTVYVNRKAMKVTTVPRQAERLIRNYPIKFVKILEYQSPDKVLHLTAIPLRSIVKG